MGQNPHIWVDALHRNFFTIPERLLAPAATGLPAKGGGGGLDNV